MKFHEYYNKIFPGLIRVMGAALNSPRLVISFQGVKYGKIEKGQTSLCDDHRGND